MPSFSIPLSGLNASSQALSTTANNLANLNTIGYKDEEIQFSDLFYQNFGANGAGDPIQQGAGVQVSAKPSNFTQGNVTPTGVSTNVAINGNGFFVIQKDGVQSYTRAGNFEVGTDNLLETVDGQQVLGYPAVNGSISTAAGLTQLELGAGTISPATVTNTVQLTSNLNATDPTGTSFSTQVGIYDSLGAEHQVTYTYTNASTPAIVGQAATGTLASSGTTPSDGDEVTIGSTTYTFKTTLTASTTANQVLIGASATTALANLVNAVNGNTADTNGSGTAGYGTSTVANTSVTAADTTPGSLITFTATTDSSTPVTATTPVGTTLTLGGGDLANGVTAVPAVLNKWSYAITIPAADISGATSPVTLGSGTLVFNGDGTLKSIAPTASSASQTNPTIGVPPTAIGPAAQQTFADGANQLTFTWDVFDSSGNSTITQTAAPDGTSSIQQNGTGSGSLENFNIGSDGTITGSFSNGKTGVVGQIALASFADEEGLYHDGDNNFSPTISSGQATIGAPSSGGLGTISGGDLEQSNVDIATEFANLIVAQRTYEANARVITTFDQIAQDTIALKT
jgi:flagellar hook protein FlgE